MHEWKYRVTFHGQDPFNSGDAKSWFEFYKMGNGVTSIPVDRELEAGDRVWFLLDGRPMAGATVIKVDYNICWNCYEAYYDSDNMVSSKEMPSMLHFYDLPAVDSSIGGITCPK